MKKLFKNKCFLAFLCSLILGCIIILPFIIIGKGVLVIWADYNVQQIPFGEIMNHSLKEGSFLWSWYNELGSNFIGTFSFYNLFSPFSIISYLFPARWYPYLSGWLMILKFGVAGLSSYLFLSRYVKNKNYAIIGSLLYAFSGYQLNSVIFHFYDSICLFPFLLYAIDNLMYDNKKCRLPFFVALMAFTNWFMFIGQCVFVAIYVIIKLIFKEYQFTIKKVLYLGFEYLLGIMISSTILIPSFLYTIDNPRIDDSWSLVSMLFYGHPTKYIEIFRSLFFPSEIMHVRAFLTQSNFDSVEFYLPFIGMILIISYIIKKFKSWDSILMLVLIIFMFIPVLNSSFFAFKTNYYARWFYMATLIGSLLSIKGLEEKISVNKGIIISCISLVLMLGLYLVLTIVYPNRNFIFDESYIVFILVFTIINLVSNYYIFRIKNIKHRNNVLFIGIILYISFWGIFTVYKYRYEGFKFNNDINNYFNVYKQLDFNDLSRTNSSKSCGYNLGYLLYNSNIKTFNSNMNGSNFEFYQGIDYSRGVTTEIDNPNINNFLSVKYIISCYDDLNSLGYKKVQENSIYAKYENPEFREMGLVLNNYISTEKFAKFKTDKKYKTLLNKIVLTNKQIKKYKNLYNNNTNVLSNKFQNINNGFNSDITLDGEKLILYTVPFDSGWTATNNDKKVKIEKVDNGLMAIKGLKGNNKIRFSYFPPGLKEGIVVSIVSILIYISIIFLMVKKEK